MLGTADEQTYPQDLYDAGCPAIVVNNRLDCNGSVCDHVVCDYVGGARQALNYLKQLGHRRIGLIRGSDDIATARDIHRTWQAALHELGEEPTADWVADGEFTEEGGAAAAGRLIDRGVGFNGVGFTALLAMNDKMAMGAMSYLSHKNIRVPQDVSVFGFDDLRHAAFVNPALTTVHLPLYDVGVTSCKRLLDRIKHGGPNNKPIRDVLDTHLIVRESTAMAAR